MQKAEDVYKRQLLDNGKWYYFAPDTGMMVRGTSVGGYYLNSDGVWVH